MILEWKSQVEVRVFSSGRELMENYQPYDAVFLDIDMQGMNGIETGKAIRSVDTDVKNCLSDSLPGLCGRSFWSSCISVSAEACEQIRRL